MAVLLECRERALLWEWLSAGVAAEESEHTLQTKHSCSSGPLDRWSKPGFRSRIGLALTLSRVRFPFAPHAITSADMSADVVGYQATAQNDFQHIEPHLMLADVARRHVIHPAQ